MEPVRGHTTANFWLLVITFGIASVGIAGLNLHIFSYVTDIGYSPLIAASFMSTIALTQLGSTLVWGVLADRFDIRKVSCVQFVIQGLGLVIAISSANILLVYTGFFLYGTGLAGSFVLLGKFFRPHLSGNGARTVAFLFTSIRRERRAVFRFSPRSYG